ncbi:hypothetical protein EGW08_004421 [Elysia chlorotica]|uniref:RNase H type-1 domain-containing protein n=1 Tax=Elysia chlorotica TaxID=188477 RepID=A0A433U1X1_ELYCH|nr:hypothetical protein EGW08_004421 [Elysia chlorotica]
MGRDRRECAAAVTEQDIRKLIHDNSKRHDPIIYTDGSVKRGIQSGWGFVCYSENRVIHEESGAAATTTSSMKMEIEAITKALEWIKLTRPTTTHAVFLTDSQSALKKIECGFMRMEWMTAVIRPTAISSITWIFCPGHAGVKGNERADKLAGKATVNGTLRLDKQEVLKALSEHLRNAEDTAAEDQQAIKRMIELGVRKGEGRGRQLVGKDRRVHNQVLTGTVSLDTLRCVLQRGAEHNINTKNINNKNNNNNNNNNNYDKDDDENNNNDNNNNDDDTNINKVNKADWARVSAQGKKPEDVQKSGLVVKLFNYRASTATGAGVDKFSADIEAMIGRKPGHYWHICWKFVAPIFIMGDDLQHDQTNSIVEPSAIVLRPEQGRGNVLVMGSIVLGLAVTRYDAGLCSS